MYLKADKCLPFSCESVSALSGRQRNISIVHSEVKKEQVDKQEVHELFLGPLSKRSAPEELKQPPDQQEYTLNIQVAL